jgi:hypothetical protein
VLREPLVIWEAFRVERVREVVWRRGVVREFERVREFVATLLIVKFPPGF